MNEREPGPRGHREPEPDGDARGTPDGAYQGPVDKIVDLIVKSLAPESTQAAREQAENAIRSLLAAVEQQEPPRPDRPRVRNTVPVDKQPGVDPEVAPRGRQPRRRDHHLVERPQDDPRTSDRPTKMTELIDETVDVSPSDERQAPRERTTASPKRRPNFSTSGASPVADDTDPPASQPRVRRPVTRPSLHTGAAASSDASTSDDRASVRAPALEIDHEADAVVERPAGFVKPLVVERSTFGSFPWWERGWWQLAPGGSARDITCDAGTLGPLAATAVSLRGHKHRLDAAPNDDAFSLCGATSLDGSDWLIGCVCDGVGSAARASEGSALVATTFTDELADLVARSEWLDGRPTSETLTALTEAVTSRVMERLGVGAEELREFETTLTFAAVARARRPDEPRHALLGWTGDSPALILRDGVWTDPSGAMGDDAVGPTSTRTAGFLTHHGLEGAVQLDLEADEVIMLCSDGVGAFVTDGTSNRTFGSTLATTIAGPVDVLHFVNLIAFDMRSADDDRTALVVWQDVRPDDATP